MKKLNAIDLDNTLIPFDSFRILVVSHLKQKKYLTPVSVIALMRKMRMIGGAEFKQRVLCCLQEEEQYPVLIHEVVRQVMSAIRSEIMEEIDDETDEDTSNVLITASPKDYVKLVAQRLGWPYMASEIKGKRFIHCHGKKKLELLLKYYPEDKFIYNFAISDSLSDLPLLQTFRKYRLLI
ncbi:hypothetical protein TRIP_B310005 [uncultured Desulfatiglans sp.]|uniref:Haloacid dehalogenase-like hydrolase n=1 Tax=Uncultured Desulfatiglans sp. TaxID=1748965 RepID=A0A653A7Q1_UNCDX|nr:hypothetical protein TRIP_B310005 [uncultured Desulfatiglans sp.]